MPTNQAQDNLWWYSDEKGLMSCKVERAARCFVSKFGQPAEVCYLHPSDLAVLVAEIKAANDAEPEAESGELVIANVRVRPLKTVLPFHFCVGLESRTVGKDNGNGHHIEAAKDEGETNDTDHRTG